MRSSVIKRWWLLILFLSVGAVFVIRENWEHILEGVRAYLQKRMSQVLQTEVNIEAVLGLNWRNITLAYLEVRGSGKESIPQVVVQRVLVEYSPWDIISGGFIRGLKVHLISPRIYFSYLPKKSQDQRGLEGNASPEDDVWNKTKISLLIENGIVFLWGAEPAITNLKGEIRVSRKRWELERLNGYLWGIPWQGDGSFSEGDIDFVFYASTEDLPELLSLIDRNGSLRLKPESLKGKNEMAFALNGHLPEISLRGYAVLMGNLAGFSGDLNFSPELLRFTILQVGEDHKLTGEVDLRQMRGYFEFTPPKGKVVLEADFSIRPKYSLKIKLDHLELSEQEIISQLKVDGEVTYAGDRIEKLCGNFYTENTIINHKVFRELKCNFELTQEMLSIESLKVGENYQLIGSITFSEPVTTDFSLDIRKADAGDLIWFAQEQNKGAISGKMNGKLTVKGLLSTPYIKWHISTDGGNLGSEKYESAVLNLEGTYPLLTVADSRIYLGQGYKLLEGKLDLRRIGKPNFFEGLKLISDQHTMVWRRWDFVREPEDSEVSMGKEVGKDFRISFKVYQESPLFDPARDTPPEFRNEVNLEYRVGGSESLKMQLKENEEIIGFEHKIKF